MICTLLTIIGGIAILAFGNKIDKKYTSKLMFARVFLQAAVIILVAILALFGKKIFHP